MRYVIPFPALGGSVRIRPPAWTDRALALFQSRRTVRIDAPLQNQIPTKTGSSTIPRMTPKPHLFHFKNHEPSPHGNQPLLGLFRAIRVGICLGAGAIGVTNGRSQAFPTENLAALHDFESRAVTSEDPTGGNRDWRNLNPGETLVLADIQGAGCIEHLRDNITSREAHHLQLHVLRMYWDGEKEPSVEVPVGDFFGIGFGFTAKVNSALIAIDQDRGSLTNASAFGAARNCYIPMPFARAARITITNEGKERSRHWFEVDYSSYRRLPSNQGYFHAQYRQGTPPPEGPYRILEATGRGHLLGCVLSVKNNDGGWWGEGDEIFEIDGEPRIHGTGSEDYFSESYGLRPGCFPYFGVTLLSEPFVTAYRWHIPDPVTFRKSIRFSIEQGNGTSPFRSGNDYYSVAYWYQKEPHAPFPKLPEAGERLSWAEPSK
jgi:D-arabinan exo alpha-(1,3)/(1,5)-arabinofuranosidase (non-reducing end)